MSIKHAMEATEENKIDDADWAADHSVEGNAYYKKLGSDVSISTSTYTTVFLFTPDLSESKSYLVLVKIVANCSDSGPWWLRSKLFIDSTEVDYTEMWQSNAPTSMQNVLMYIATTPSPNPEIKVQCNVDRAAAAKANSCNIVVMPLENGITVP